MKASELRREILAAGERLGFYRPRIAQIAPLDRDQFLAQWLSEGRAGDMRFLLHHRKARLDPRTRYPWANTVISAFFPYRAPPRFQIDWRAELRGRIAAYALGPDYHDVVAERLAEWARAIEGLAPGTRARSFVDTGAVLEHEWARNAGVGWTGRHTLTLSEEAGSYAFLAELLISLSLEPDAPVADRCGTCTRCIDICPTGALEEGYRLDPRRCISYLTIEHRGAIPRELRPQLGEWVFGCDLCQIACPWNRDEAGPETDLLAPLLAELLQFDEDAFARRYSGSALTRTGVIGLARNAATVLGNTGNPRAIPLLTDALTQHPSALVRAHAADALGRLASLAADAVRPALEHARRDVDRDVRAEADAALESSGL